MTIIAEEIGIFLAESEEKTVGEFMTIAGLGKEYQKARSIPKIKTVLEKFAERGYRIDKKEILNEIDVPMLKWRMSLLLDDNEIIRQDIRIIIHTIKRQ